MMTFPETWEEFEKSYGFIDSEEVYTNGSRLIPSFRVKQWLDHIAQYKTKRQVTVSSDCISRKDAIKSTANAIWHYPNELYASLNCFENCQELAERALSFLPSAKSEIIWCKDCKHLQKWRSEESAKKFGQIYECGKDVLDCPKTKDFCSRAERRIDG